MRTHFALALVGLVFGSSLGAQRAPAPPPAWREFAARFDSLALAERIVGASALLVRDGRVVARHHFGHADLAVGRRVDDATVFHWGSITKTLTAIAILQLRERGRLELDDPVTRWIPELRHVNDPFGMTDSITIRMLLTHSAGYQGPTWPWRRHEDWEPFEPTSWEQLVAMMPYQRLLFRPGTRTSYSNPGFVYLARIIEKVSGDAWQTYVQKNLLSPLRLEGSYFGVTPYHLSADRSHNYLVGHDAKTGRDTIVDRGADFDPGITIPNGGWNAPLEDLARYTIFLTGAARDSATAWRHDVVLSRRALEEMWQSVHPLTPGRASADSMALAFFVHHRHGMRVIGHTGQQAAFRSFLYVNPATRAGVVVAYNTTNTTTPSHFARVTDYAMELLR